MRKADPAGLDPLQGSAPHSRTSEGSILNIEDQTPFPAIAILLHSFDVGCSMLDACPERAIASRRVRCSTTSRKGCEPYGRPLNRNVRKADPTTAALKRTRMVRTPAQAGTGSGSYNCCPQRTPTVRKADPTTTQKNAKFRIRFSCPSSR